MERGAGVMTNKYKTKKVVLVFPRLTAYETYNEYSIRYLPTGTVFVPDNAKCSNCECISQHVSNDDKWWGVK